MDSPAIAHLMAGPTSREPLRNAAQRLSPIFGRGDGTRPEGTNGGHN